MSEKSEEIVKGENPEEIKSNTDVVTGYYEQDGYKIHYEKVGHGDCVVFMFPGACGHSRADFGPQLDGFDKDKFTLVAWDSPGFGLSRPPERDYQKHAEEKFFYQYDAETVVKLMAHLGYDSFSVMGWSDGGKSALLVPILFPAKVEKLVVWGTLAYIPEKYKVMWRILCTLEMWEEARRKEYIKLYGNRETLEKIWYKHMSYTYTTTDICKDRVKEIKCPTFVLHGKKDTMIPKEFFDHLVANIPDVESHLFPDGVHDIHISHAEAFNKMVQRFLLD